MESGTVGFNIKIETSYLTRLVEESIELGRMQKSFFVSKNKLIKQTKNIDFLKDMVKQQLLNK